LGTLPIFNRIVRQDTTFSSEVEGERSSIGWVGGVERPAEARGLLGVVNVGA
jgi:hypothetical protein